MIGTPGTLTHVVAAGVTALVVAGVLAFGHGGMRAAALYVAVAAVCLLVIAFADALGETVGWGGAKGPRVNVASPGWLVRLVAWGILLVISCILVWIRLD